MDAMFPAIGVLLGHYRLAQQIGRGGMGIVFLARDERLERDVAVKILPPGTFANETARKRFHKEARVLAKLSHPNIAMAFDFGNHNEIDYLVTEYIAGPTLAAKLASGPLSQTAVIHLGLQLAKGLAAAHREHIIHCDLKPSNLRLSRDDELKILDFGLAHCREPVTDLAATLSSDSPNAMAGTLPFMAPEQIRCEEADCRTDIWGAGTVLYFLATGRRPFPAESSLKLIDAIQHSTPIAPSTLNRNVTTGLDSIITKSLDKDPARRYQSASELAVDLARLLPSSEASHQSADHIPKPPRNLTNLFGWIGLAAFACLLGFVLYRARPRDMSSVSAYKLLVVLPFDSSGQDEKTNALIGGLAETVAAKLVQSGSHTLQIVSVRDAREQGVKTADQALREFGADLVIEGTAHRVGDEIRVNCSLVDSKTRRQLSARTITAEIKDTFSLEDQVANEISSLIAPDRVLSAGNLMSPRLEANSEAYASYLRGKGYLSEYQRPENIKLAIAELSNAISQEPNFPNSYAALGEAYLLGYQQTNQDSNFVDRALTTCRRSLQVRETTDGRVCLGDVYHTEGKYDLAVQEFQRAVQLDPKNEEGIRGVADAFAKLGNAAQAEEAYRKAISLRPNYWGVYSWLGTFYYDRGRYEDAVDQFKRVIELAPLNYRGYSNLGAMLIAQGRYPEAIDTLSKSIEIRPNLEAFNNLGNAYFQLHRYPEAAQSFQRGLNLDDRDWLLWGNLGDSLFWSGRVSEATAAYQKAIDRVGGKLKVNPNDAVVLAFDADYEAMSGNHRQAVGAIERAITLAPDDGEVRLRAAIVYNQLGDTNASFASLRKAISLGYSRQAIKDTPDFAHLRSDPQYRALRLD